MDPKPFPKTNGLDNLPSPRLTNIQRFKLWIMGLSFIFLAALLTLLYVQQSQHSYQIISEKIKLHALLSAQNAAQQVTVIFDKYFVELLYLGNALLPLDSGTHMPSTRTLEQVQVLRAQHPKVIAINIQNALGNRILWSTLPQRSQPIVSAGDFALLPDHQNRFVGKPTYDNSLHAWAIAMRYVVHDGQGKPLFIVASQINMMKLNTLAISPNFDLFLLDAHHSPFVFFRHGRFSLRPSRQILPARGQVYVQVPEYPWTMEAKWPTSMVEKIWWHAEKDRLPIDIGIVLGILGLGTLSLFVLAREMRLHNRKEDVLIGERDHQKVLALHDPLTNLPNRTYFLQTGKEALAQAQREQKQLAIGILDLDGFKEVNDTFGHNMGDQLLQSIARRLQDIYRGDDVITRLGGDEFGFHFIIGNAGDLALISERILTAVIGAVATMADMPISGSIGWAIFPGDGDDFNTLFAHADEAMYAAKAAGKSTFRLYGGPVCQLAQQRIWVHQHLPRAIGSEQLRFFLQPQADMLAGRLDGVEMLVRWRREDGRWNTPGKFMSIVEADIHLIRELGIWGFQEAARLRQRFVQLGLDLGVSLNIGARHFLHPAFLDDLEQHCPRGNGLTLEITETAALTDLKTSAKIAVALKDRGFRLSMDDFGTGYSSLLYAAKLPFDELKLDQDFIRNFRHDPASFAVAGAARLLGDLSGRSLIAEGIANPEDLALWMRMGGTRIQGYHLSPPIPENAFVTWHSCLLPRPQSKLTACPLDDLPILIHIAKSSATAPDVFRHTARTCPMGTWFDHKQEKYGQLPSFREAKIVHERLHRLTKNNSITERAATQQKMCDLAIHLCEEVAHCTVICGSTIA